MIAGGGTSGTLVLVVGPSGAGKDTLIDYARVRLGERPDFAFPKRTISRGIAAGEDHETVSEEEFRARAAAGAFALLWQAHGLSYGIPAEIDEFLAEGMTVVVNVSRTILGAARLRYPGLLVVNVVAPPEILAERLARRGREGELSVKGRVARNEIVSVSGNDVVEIANVATPDVAGDRFVEVLVAMAGSRARS